MSLVAYVAEDGLLSHQWEERPLVLGRLYALVQGNTRPPKEKLEKVPKELKGSATL